jgi:two-component system phosphate regulon sensor histidine kinase PhoR
MESGRRRYHMRETDLYAIVAEATSAFEPMREQRGAALRCDLPPGLPPVQADRAAVSDALLNLLTNACKYGGDPPQIHVTAEVRGRNVGLVVSDNGPGIPAREHKRIFQKFYRVDDRMSRQREGSGLGLAIVHHVAKAHAGSVEVKSAPGTGSAFTLWLPVVEKKAVRSQPPTGFSDRPPATDSGAS